ncbi:Flp pilus assembly complex ATPase component TadA, partial [bacterium]|nr:Flp pilus assembly complex ATPase component TadA [bacterium]MBU1615144.1 Flp pilus assembly complex ATPase component TadA [bacterium]
METKREDIEQRGHRKRLRLGDMLVKEDVITQDQLNEALKEQKRTNERLGQILMRLEFVNEETILKFLSSQLSIPYATSLADIDEIPKEVAEIIPEFFIRRRKLFPISMEEDSLLVAMADPLDIFALDDVKVLIGDMKLKPIISSEREINALIEKHYGKSMAMEELMKDMEADELQVKEEKEEDIDLSKLTTDSKSAPVVRLVNHILLEAIKQGASDIHIEPYEKHVRTRYRVDGVLHDAGHHPKSAQAAIISRIKIISRLDISERRLPQDGRARVKVGGRDVDLRVSVTPTNFGEKVVIRILDPASL